MSVTTTKLVNIPKYPTPMSIEVKDTTVGDVAKVIVYVDGNVTNNVTIEIDGVNYTAKVEGGKATFNVEGLKAGEKTVVAIYEGDNDYEFNSTTEQFTVYKNDVSMSVSAVVDKSTGQVTITLSGLPSDATGYAIVDVNGTEYGINITKTKEITIPILKSGHYSVKAT